MNVVLISDDIDQHDDGCACGLCNSDGRSYGVGVYTLVHLLHEYCPEHDTDGGMGCRHDEVVNRVYGPSEMAAFDEAKWLCHDNGWTVIS